MNGKAKEGSLCFGCLGFGGFGSLGIIERRRRFSLSRGGRAMFLNMTADEVRALLKLEPNQTCGFVRETDVSALKIAPGGLPAPFADGRRAGSTLYFLMTPQAPVKLHRIRNDQLYQLLSRRSDRGADAAFRPQPLTCHGRARPPRRPHRAALHPWQHLPHRAHQGWAAAAPNGQEWFRPRMSNSAMPTSSRRNTQRSLPRSAPSQCRLSSVGK